MQHILTATDLTPRSDRAVRRAFRLAAAKRAKLTVLAVTDPDLPAAMATARIEETRAHLTRFCGDTDAGAGVDWNVEVTAGDVAETVILGALHGKADLLVLGLHRARTMFDSIRETTLERILRTTTKPALVVVDPPDHDYARVLAPVDFSPAATAAVTAAHDLAPAAKVTLLHAVHVAFVGLMGDDPDDAMIKATLREARARAEAWRGAQHPSLALPQVEVTQGGLQAAFDDAFRRVRPQLVVVGAHSRHGMAYRMLGSFAAGLVRDAPTDLLLACR